MFPWRPGGNDTRHHDKDAHDRHGIPRCKHCGAPTRFVRFDAGDQAKPKEQRNPRLWVLCMSEVTPKCAKEQTVPCRTVYRLLVPLWRADELYHEPKESHGSYEAQHHWWGDRYKVAADDRGLRPKIRDIGFHRLRANVAALVDWLRICYREDWLGNPRRNGKNTERRFQDRGHAISRRLAEMRGRTGLMAAYGGRRSRCFQTQCELHRHAALAEHPSGRPRSTSWTRNRAST